MGVFPEAEARLYQNVYICRRCETKTRVAVGRILAGKGVCRKCSYKHLRKVRARAKK